MGLLGNKLGLVMRAVVAVALAVTAVACTPDRRPDDPAPTTTPPRSDELRYEPIGGEELCGLIRWDDIASEFGMTVGEVRHAGGRTCRFRRLQADYLDEDYSSTNLGELNFFVSQEPQDAHSYYTGVIPAALNHHPDAVVTEPDGWWTLGLALEAVRSRGRGYDGVVNIHVYHENLYLNILLGGKMESRRDIASLRGMARALIDEARTHVPCRSLGDQQAADCPDD